MIISKWAKIAIPTVAVVLVVLLVLSVIAYWFAVSSGLYPKFFERSGKKTVASMEKKFIIVFPEGIREVKAATKVSWDNWTSVVIRFVAEPNIVERFLGSISVRHLETYTAGSSPNGRSNYEPFSALPPEFFTEPIRRGKRGKFSLAWKKSNFRQGAYIFIDNSDENTSVVYIYATFYGTLP